MTDASNSNPGVKELSGQIGKYNIVKPLGKGAMGMVYLAHDTILERDVALKVMVSQIADDPELNQRFIREAKAVAKMTHPNVVQVFDLGSHTDGSPYIAMELLKGMDLQKAMRTPPSMSLDRKVAIIVQVLAGLAHAHQAGIVHRDIKPANIFINHDGSVKIMDFGVARLTSASMTGTGNIVGTADYMSPEQVKGAKVDGRSDLFSVGCMLFELLAGHRPFHSDNLMAIFYKITHEEPNFDAIPEGADYDALLPVLKKSLAKNLEDRYQNAYEFAVDLRDYLKSYATGASGEHALEGLLDLEPPPTDAPAGATLVDADQSEVGGTVDLGPTAVGNRTPTMREKPPSGRMTTPTQLSKTRSGGQAPTVVGPPPTGRSGSMRPQKPAVPIPPRVQPRPQPHHSTGSPMLYGIVGALIVALAVTGGYIYFNQNKRVVDVPPTTVASMPPATPPPVTTAPPATLPPPTPAPPPTFAEAKGKGAVTLKAAQAAFKAGDYARAQSQAQASLAEDPSSQDARRMLDNARKGLAAVQQMGAADAALRNNDFAAANAAAQRAHDEAPWDARVTDLMGRINRAQDQARQQAEQQKQAEAQKKQAEAAAQVKALLAQGEAALATQKFDAAIAFYDQVLALESNNTEARIGRTSAIGAKAMAQSQPSGGGAKSFVSGKTVAKSAEKAAGGGVPAGFEDTPGVKVNKGTAAVGLPGKITFDVEPNVPKPGDRYSVKVMLSNEGAAPIQIRDMIVRTTINGRGGSNPVPPVTKEVAPQQTSLLFNIGGEVWKEDTTSWTMDVTVHTMRAETYSNQLSWK